jgi:hypothetical protein
MMAGYFGGGMMGTAIGTYPGTVMGALYANADDDMAHGLVITAARPRVHRCR